MADKIRTKEYRKRVDFKTKAGKLFLAQQSGLTDSEASRKIGISEKNVTELEATKTYQAIIKSFKDAILEKTTISNLAEELNKNIKQDADKGAKNNAIKIALDKIEPENLPQTAQQVNIVLK